MKAQPVVIRSWKALMDGGLGEASRRPGMWPMERCHYFCCLVESASGSLHMSSMPELFVMNRYCMCVPTDCWVIITWMICIVH